MQEENTIPFNYSLSPFAFFYGIGVRLRNWMFNKGILPTVQYPVPVICIGNLAVGGTGKTPHTELIIRILKSDHRLAVLSRGYKRKTKGFLLANDKSSSLTIGDEPYQIKQKFPDILVAVDENRRRGIDHLLALKDCERPGIILLDDAFQHRYVTPSLSVILTDFNRLYYRDKLLPVGRLREPADSIERADIIVVTKCPEELKPIDYRIIESNMGLRPHQVLYFSKVVYDELQPVFPNVASEKSKKNIKPEDKLLVIAGIADPTLFIEEVQKLSKHIYTVLFPDHHNFNKQSIEKIQKKLKDIPTGNTFIITTEKDAARLKNNSLVPEEWKDRMYFLPITIDFATKNNISFDELIKKHLYYFKKNSILLLNR